ncbi:hypothetical protein [Paenibacillus sp. MMS20-IR301]|nr:hypothetical protein [Paenibacillus sp. MMS20-IR301]WNS45047.1 hypothetical protein LOS79_07200 [Paenibacillus sp. MMS20-IR301]
MIELGLAATVEEAEVLAKEKRPDIKIKQDMREMLKGFYPSK